MPPNKDDDFYTCEWPDSTEPAAMDHEQTRLIFREDAGRVIEEVHTTAQINRPTFKPLLKSSSDYHSLKLTSTDEWPVLTEVFLLFRPFFHDTETPGIRLARAHTGLSDIELTNRHLIWFIPELTVDGAINWVSNRAGVKFSSKQRTGMIGFIWNEIVTATSPYRHLHETLGR